MMEYKTTDYFGSTKEIVERAANENELAYIELRQQKLQTLAAETETKAATRAALLERLGITEDEAKLLLS
jgi:hypothetical protein